jgi:hypothetical protein
MKKFSLLLACILTLVSTNVFAEDGENNSGVFFEPGVSWSRLTGDLRYPNTLSNSEVKSEGPGAFARVGVHFWRVLFLAADGHYQRPTFTDSTNNIETKADVYNFSPVLGAQMPVAGLRVWAGYVFAGAADLHEVNGFDMKLSDPEGWRLGAGIKIYFTSLNFEYQDIEYNDIELQSRGRLTLGSTFNNISFREKGWLASLSFPLAL